VRVISVNLINIDSYGHMNFKVVVDIWRLISLKQIRKKYMMTL
jgi:hypothetical protein